ncbi:4'-phosphopantetheinyl transferase family protein [Parapedobacter sp.]
MGSTTIISTWINEPQWTDGRSIAQGSRCAPYPSLWLIDPERANDILIDRHNVTLGKDELARAARFHQPRHQTRYKMAHTLLRILLADITHSKPSSLQFIAGHHNKPKLLNEQAPSIAFNLSYTENKLMIVIADGADVGVDIEWLHRPIAIDDMLEACFSSNEIDYINSKQHGVRNRFFTLWTRKEAILKLTGEGIGEHLPLFEVLDGTCITKKEIIGGNPPDRIHLYSFAIDDGYIACYAASEPLDKVPVYLI